MNDWKRWREHFEANAKRPRPVIESPEGVAKGARGAVAEALARFQLGETGEGRIAHEIDRAAIGTIDDDYRRSLKLFVAEEGRHARILGDAVRALGGETIRQSASHSAFTRGRRAVGVRTKLLALLGAEVVGIGFYGHLARHLGDGPIRRALRQIATDEAAHLRFHARFFRREVRAAGLVGAAAFRTAWWPLALGATAALVRIERETLDAVGASGPALSRRYLILAKHVDGAVLGGADVSLEPGGLPKSSPLETARGPLRATAPG